MKALFLIAVCFLSFQISQAQWQTEVRLTNDPAVSSAGFGASRTIAADGSTIHIVFYDNRSGNNEIYYKRSIDNGSTWGADIRLTNDTAVSINPSISVSGLFVHITWDDKSDGIYKVYYIRSSDGGLSWGTVTGLSNGTASTYHYSSIASSGSNLHVVWFDRRDAGDAEIYYKNSADNGDTWSADTRLTFSLGNSYIPVVAVSGSNVHVAWYDDADGNKEIYYKRSTDNGTSWGASTRLTNDPGESIYPTIAVSGSTVHVAWRDWRNRETWRIYYKRSTNNGASWGTDIAIDGKKYAYTYPCFAVNGSAVHIVYVNLNNHGNGYDIIYNKSLNSGATWGTELVLISNPSSSLYPSIAVSGTSLHVLFQDDRDGNSEIYYKRNLTGAARPIEITGTNSVTPNQYSLSQNYPNPFNPSTKIKFALPNTSFAKLVVFDALGREVETLVNEQLNAGAYEINWNASNYPSGVYYYTITSGGFIQTNKMILLK